MALILIEGFEDQGMGWTASGGTPIQAAAARTGPSGCRLANASNFIYTFPVAQQSATCILGLAVRFPSPFFTGTNIIRIGFVPSSAGGSSFCDFAVYADGHISLVKGGTPTVLASSAAGTVVADTWYYFELRWFHNTSGSAELRMNGATLLTFTGDTLTGAGTAPLLGIRFENTPAQVLHLDDMYIMNNASDPFLGDSMVETIYPSAPGDTTAWTPSVGTQNYQTVDEPGTYDPSDYVKAGTSGQRDLYNFADLSIITGGIFGVQHVAQAANIDAAASHSVKLVNHHATDATQTFTLTTTFQPLAWVLQNDPDTGAAWLAANVNALQAGVEVV
jgi:hypothetical protein